MLVGNNLTVYYMNVRVTYSKDFLEFLPQESLVTLALQSGLCSPFSNCVRIWLQCYGHSCILIKYTKRCTNITSFVNFWV